MPHFYCDSSALVKRYIDESGSHWIETLHQDHLADLYTSAITKVEVAAALSRRLRTENDSLVEYNEIMKRFDKDFQELYSPIAVSASVIDTAIDLTKRNSLRGYDAVQLASALLVQQILQQAELEPLTFISSDTRLNAVAATERLFVENPNDHATPATDDVDTTPDRSGTNG